MKIIYKLILSFSVIVFIYNGGLFSSLNMIERKSKILIKSYDNSLTSVNNIRASWDNFRSARDISQSVLYMTKIHNKNRLKKSFNNYYQGFISPLKNSLTVYEISSKEYKAMTLAISIGEKWKQDNGILLFSNSFTSVPSYVEMNKLTKDLEVNINQLIKYIVEKYQSTSTIAIS